MPVLDVPPVRSEREKRTDAILQAARTTPLAQGGTVSGHPGTASPQTELLRDVRQRLAIACAVAFTAAAALKNQGADNDADVSVALQHCVGNEIDRQIERIDGLIGEVVS